MIDNAVTSSSSVNGGAFSVSTPTVDTFYPISANITITTTQANQPVTISSGTVVNLNIGSGQGTWPYGLAEYGASLNLSRYSGTTPTSVRTYLNANWFETQYVYTNLIITLSGFNILDIIPTPGTYTYALAISWSAGPQAATNSVSSMFITGSNMTVTLLKR